MTTYPRTDARVLSTAISKVIDQNITGLMQYEPASIYAKAVLQHASYKGIAKTRYVNDKAITDHYAIIPTGQGLQNLKSLSPTAAKVYEIIVRRFLAVFYPPATYQKVSIVWAVQVPETDYTEHFYSGFKVLTGKGYLHVMDYSFFKKKEEQQTEESSADGENENSDEEAEMTDEEFFEELKKLKKGSVVALKELNVKEGETAPPKRYNSGTIILTMENAGQFIEDDELRAQIKGSGIGTSATRAGILTKLVNIHYLNLNKKTQIITPTQLGEMIYETVTCSMKPMLNPSLTASWEKGLTAVAEGEISEAEYMKKLDDFVRRRTNQAKQSDYRGALKSRFDLVSANYKKK